MTKNAALILQAARALLHPGELGGSDEIIGRR